MSLSAKENKSLLNPDSFSLVIEESDINFKKIEKKLSLSGYKVMRVEQFDQAVELVKEKEFQKIVCSIDLSRAEVFEFIGIVKKLPYHHSNLVINTEEVLSSLKKVEEFQTFLNAPEASKSLDPVLENNFDKIDPQSKALELLTQMKLSSRNEFSEETSYIFLAGEKTISMGAAESLADFKNVILDISYEGKQEEYEIKGEFKKVKPFDENKGNMSHYSFQVADDSLELWAECLAKIEEDDTELDQLLAHLRGY